MVIRFVVGDPELTPTVRVDGVDLVVFPSTLVGYLLAAGRVAGIVVAAMLLVTLSLPHR